jgi:tetratricopeptide (TPR) repeat protein
MDQPSSDDSALELRRLGELARRNGDLVAAQLHYEEATRLLQTSPARLTFAHVVRHLGDVCAERRDYERAGGCYIEALKIYRSEPSPRPLDVANAVRAYAKLLSDTGRNDIARGFWAEAGGLYENMGIAEGVEECQRRVSDDPEW